MIDRILAGFRAPILVDDIPIDTRLGIGLKGSRGPGAGEDLRAALSAAQEGRASPPRLGLVRPQDRRGASPRLPPA